MALFQQPNIESGARYTVFDPSALSADRDLRTTFPGYDADSPLDAAYPALESKQTKLPRFVMFFGGDLVVIDEIGNEVTFAEDPWAGTPMPIAPAQVKDTGSTATACLVVW